MRKPLPHLRLDPSGGGFEREAGMLCRKAVEYRPPGTSSWTHLRFSPHRKRLSPDGWRSRIQKAHGLAPKGSPADLSFCVYATFGSGTDYRQVLRDYAGRLVLVHFKDSLRKPDGNEQLTPLGEGSHNWQPIAAACESSGVKWVFAEQEQWDRDAFECSTVSFCYLNKVLNAGKNRL